MSAYNSPMEQEQLKTKKTIIAKTYPWLVITASAFFLFYKYVLQVSPGIMTHDLMEAFNVTGAGLGNLAACYFYTFLLMQIPVGVLLDRFSPRHLTSIAIGLCAIGSIAFAFAPTLWFAALARALIGFGAAFATVSYMKVATLWFPPERFSIIAGLLATAAMLGAIGGQAPLAAMVDALDWKNTLIVCGVIGLVFAAIFWLLVKEESPYAQPTPLQTHQEDSIWSGLMAVLRQPQNWLLSFYSGLAFAPVDVFAGLWGVPYLMEAYTLPRTSAAAIVSTVFVGLAIGAPIFGWISDRIGHRRRVMQWGTTMSFIGLMSAVYIPHLPLAALIGLLFLFGFGTGSFMLGFVVGKEINSIALAATVIAVINTSDALWGAISEPLIGKFLDLGWDGTLIHGVREFSTHNYHMALLILPTYLIAALILLLFIRDSGRNVSE